MTFSLCWADERVRKPVKNTAARPCFVFLVCIRCNKVVIWCVDDTCGQRPSCVRRSLHFFPYCPICRSALIVGPKEILFTRKRTRCRLSWLCGRQRMSKLSGKYKQIFLLVNWTPIQLKNKNQLDATYYFIVLVIGSTCFAHYYTHHQELATIMSISLQNETTNVVINIIIASSWWWA